MLKGGDQNRYPWRKRRCNVAEDEETGFIRREGCAADLICDEFVQGPAGGGDNMTSHVHDLVAGSRVATPCQSQRGGRPWAIRK